MNMPKVKTLPTVWMNVTTSANWNRPAVGIVRVEQALCAELSKSLLQTRFKQCIWSEGEFVEWIPESKHPDKRHEKVAEIIFPQSKSFDISRKFLARALRIFEQAPPAKSSAKFNCLDISVPLDARVNTKPVHGDIIISVGLDWDQSYTSAFFNLSKKNGIKIITCCYDLIPVLFPQYCVGDVASRFKEYFNMLTWGSAAVLCISKQTQNDYLALCSQLGAPERPTCILPLGDNVPSGNGDVSPAIEAVLAEPFILFVSTIERRKNHEVLYRAYHLLCRLGHKHLLPKLVFVGMPGWGVGDLLKDIELDPLTQGLIIQLNHVNDGELGELYKKALFCVYPSLYEGWGLPVGEALAVGKAVLASNQGSLPEVGGSLVKYLDPWNSKSWADAILEWVTSPSVIQQMERKVVEQYEVRTWADAAKSVERLIDQLTTDDSDAQTVLYPGYDMSTQVGLHVGPCIKATGKDGFLMYGPHHALAQGNYTVQVFDAPQDRTPGQLTVDFVGNKGKVCFWRGDFEVKQTHAEDAAPLFQFDVCIDSEVEDYEIRCIVGDANLKLCKILISKIPAPRKSS
jgi:glycosyltransferase involved in cell wall biosynthesis